MSEPTSKGMRVSEFRVMITSPLEVEHVDYIRGQLPDGVTLIHEPDLLPPTRYVGDHHGVDGFEHTPEQRERWNALIASANALFDFPFTDRHPHEYAPNLKWVQTTSAGVGQAVYRMNVRPGELVVTTASGVHARPLAEFVFMVLLMAVKRHALLVDDQRHHRWERFCSDELSGKTLAIVGPGRIGREIARIARTFDMSPVAMARDSRPERSAELGLDRLYGRNELHDMLSVADAVVLCAPHTPDTDTIMGAEEFKALKKGVIFINIARGQLVDEQALQAALLDGTISFAGLDVFRTEPLPADSAFWDMPNVLVNPHSASTSDRENRRIADIFIHNLQCFVAGRVDEMRNVLDIERMY